MIECKKDQNYHLKNQKKISMRYLERIFGSIYAVNIITNSNQRCQFVAKLKKTLLE